MSNKLKRDTTKKTVTKPIKAGRKPAKLGKVRLADPFLERELAKYEYPLPSREYVLQTLAHHGVPLSFEQICKQLAVRADELEPFQRRLGAMAREGQLMQNRAGAWLIPDKADLIRGRIEGHPEGYGFLIQDPASGEPAAAKASQRGNDIFLGPREMEQVMHGDRAIVRLIGVDRRGRPEGKIVEVLERANKRVVGRVFNEHGIWFVVAENRRITQDILIAPPVAAGKPRKAKAAGKAGKHDDLERIAHEVRTGQVVVAEIIEQPSRQSQPIGRVVEILGNYADAGMEIEIALRKHELPFEFGEAALAETKKLPSSVRKSDWKGREDITRLPLVTIDGETARDFDDAVYCERYGRGSKAGFRLIVAIADVSHYVAAGGALDKDAYERGTSVYFPRRVIPMLPEKLSNGLCSLNPQVERLCMVCDMKVSANGEIQSYRFYPAVMFSHARLTYTEVAAALYDKDAATRDKLAVLLPHLENLDALYRVFAKARKQRGAIDFETLETRMIFDDNGKIARIEAVQRNEAHKLIEECMLAANVCASIFLHEKSHPALYRVHQGPTAERLLKLRDFLGGFGLQIGGGAEPCAKDYAELLDKLAGRPDRQLLQTVMLRSLRQAVYSPDNVGHFGLAYDSYTHFTSPIRRYPDLLVHRAIKAVLNKTRYAPGGAEAGWDNAGTHCSMTERRADDATRDVEAWLKCFYMQDRIGEEFYASISSVLPFGIFVALDEVFIEGLVHVSELGADYFHFDEAGHVMVGERTGRRFRLADRVRVQLVRVDLETNKIDFKLLDLLTPAGQRQGKLAETGARGAAKPVRAKAAPPAKAGATKKSAAARKGAGGKKTAAVRKPAPPKPTRKKGKRHG